MNYTERFEDYYEILGISRNASVDEIKKAKRELSKKYHPDKFKDEELKRINGEKLAIINNAADVLLDPSKKFAYDIEYDQRKQAEQARKQQEEQARYEQSWYDYDFRRTSSTNQTDQNWYDNGFQRENSQRTYSRQYQRATAGQEQKRATAGTTEKKQHTRRTSMFDDLKRAAREVKEDEVQQRKGARRAHKNVNDFINRKFGRRDSVPEEILYKFSKGTLHVIVSTLRELYKLSYITKDSFPKFVIRNRRGIAVGLTALMLFSGLGNSNENNTPVIPSEQPSISVDYEQDDKFVADIEEDVMLQEEEEISTYTVKRNYTIKYGDTLSALAEEMGIPMSEIQYENNIMSPNLIRVGDKLTFTYNYSSEDLEYFTNTVTVPSGTTVKDLAKQYNTDTVTIIALNGDSIVYMDGGYYIITSTVKVPNFATQRDIEEAKQANIAYQKHQ